MKSAQACVEISSPGLLENMVAIQVENVGILAKTGPFKKIAPKKIMDGSRLHIHPILWSNKPNLSSAFRLSQRSLSLRGSRVTNGVIFCCFR